MNPIQTYYNKFMLSTKVTVILIVLALLGLWLPALVIAVISTLSKFKAFSVPDEGGEE